MPTTISTRAVPLVLAAILAACGGSGTTAPPPTSAAVPNTPPSTILDTTTTPTTAQAAPSTAAPTTSAAPATTDEIVTEPDIQAVVAAAEHAWHAFNAVKLEPANDQKASEAIASHTGAAQARVRDIIDQYRTSNWQSMTSDVVPASVEVIPGSVSVEVLAGVAQAEVCNLGSNVLVEIGGNADGSDRVLDDTVTAYRTLETYHLVEGRWLKADGVVVAEFPGELTCDPRGD